MRALLTFVWLAVMIPMSGTAVAGDRDRSVDCDEGESIQRAVNKARDGGTIKVYGTCTEQVIVDKDRVEIVGVGDATVIGPPDSFATFVVQGKRVTIEGFTLKGEIGVLVTDGGSAWVQNNVITDVTSTGVTVDDGSYGNVGFNQVVSQGFSGIFLFNGASAEINQNSVTTPAGSGIGIEGNSSAALRGNTVFDTINGIQATESSYVWFPSGDGAPNTLNNNLHGVNCTHDSVIRVDAEQNFSGNSMDAVAFEGCTVRNFVGAPFPLP